MSYNLKLMRCVVVLERISSDFPNTQRVGSGHPITPLQTACLFNPEKVRFSFLHLLCFLKGNFSFLDFLTMNESV